MVALLFTAWVHASALEDIHVGVGERDDTVVVSNEGDETSGDFTLAALGADLSILSTAAVPSLKPGQLAEVKIPLIKPPKEIIVSRDHNGILDAVEVIPWPGDPYEIDCVEITQPVTELEAVGMAKDGLLVRELFGGIWEVVIGVHCTGEGTDFKHFWL
jgi:hypothetical protein